MTRMSWIEVEIFVGINHLRKYHTELEEMIEGKLTEFNEIIDNDVKDLSPEDADTFYDFHSDEYWELKDEFPNTLRKSIFNLTFSYFEKQLKKICLDITPEGEGLPKKTNNKESIIEFYKIYIESKLNKKLDDKKEIWKSIDQNRMIRNQLIHDYGELVDISNNISDIIHNNSNIQVKDDNIYLQKEFVEQFITDIEKFLKHTAAEIKLRRN